MSDARRGGLAVSAWCTAAAFGAYFCMYAFRKPFTAAAFKDASLAGLALLDALVIAQTLGYMLSKFIGIKVVSELPPARRVALLLALIAVAEAALVLFALTPPPLNAFCLFLNGIPLGMVFGLVTAFLEGRRHTEALMAGLCASFIVADGVVKSVGAWLLTLRVSEYWMPAVTGALFVPPTLLFAWMLSRIPPPNDADVEARCERTTMDGPERGALFRRYAAGLTLLVVVYTLVTVLRSLRADFAPRIWEGLQAQVPADVFARSETAVGAMVLVLFGATALIHDNRRAFFAGIALALAGSLLVAVALLARQAGALEPFAFMVTIGFGLYLPYIAIHTIVFERLLAMTCDRGTIAYLITLADSFGYLGVVAVLLGRNFLQPGATFLPFFLGISWVIAVACVLLLVPCWGYFAAHPATRRAAA
jgi:hypothetical protein